MFPLGTAFVNAPKMLLEHKDRVIDEMGREGVELKWMGSESDEPGLFEWTWRGSFLVTGFHATPEKEIGEVQASAGWIFAGVVVIVVAVATGFVIHDASLAIRKAPEVVQDLSAAATTIAISVALIALVYLLSKRP